MTVRMRQLMQLINLLIAVINIADLSIYKFISIDIFHVKVFYQKSITLFSIKVTLTILFN